MKIHSNHWYLFASRSTFPLLTALWQSNHEWGAVSLALEFGANTRAQICLSVKKQLDAPDPLLNSPWRGSWFGVALLKPYQALSPGGTRIARHRLSPRVIGSDLG